MMPWRWMRSLTSRISSPLWPWPPSTSSPSSRSSRRTAISLPEKRRRDVGLKMPWPQRGGAPRSRRRAADVWSKRSRPKSSDWKTSDAEDRRRRTWRFAGRRSAAWRRSCWLQGGEQKRKRGLQKRELRSSGDKLRSADSSRKWSRRREHLLQRPNEKESSGKRRRPSWRLKDTDTCAQHTSGLLWPPIRCIGPCSATTRRWLGFSSGWEQMPPSAIPSGRPRWGWPSG
mmetsp:Transcript_101258/g.241498  ORF Transcript_101258/g.241498 Transcript_101258/m.241498 type:complete len:229 (-) Transcript_101258:423-1109(-)